MDVTVTPSVYGSGVAWNPWAELRRREDIVFRLTSVAALAGGAAYYRRGDRVAIIIDPALHRVDRNAALAHELVHDELGPKESVVAKEVARRLVPLDQLARFVDAHLDIAEGVHVDDVADHFEVPAPVARRAMELLKEDT